MDARKRAAGDISETDTVFCLGSSSAGPWMQRADEPVRGRGAYDEVATT